MKHVICISNRMDESAIWEKMARQQENRTPYSYAYTALVLTSVSCRACNELRSFGCCSHVVTKQCSRARELC